MKEVETVVTRLRTGKASGTDIYDKLKELAGGREIIGWNVAIIVMPTELEHERAMIPDSDIERCISVQSSIAVGSREHAWALRQALRKGTLPDLDAIIDKGPQEYADKIQNELKGN